MGTASFDPLYAISNMAGRDEGEDPEIGTHLHNYERSTEWERTRTKGEGEKEAFQSETNQQP